MGTESTHMESSRSIAVHPSYHNVRLEHPSIWRDTKANPSIGAYIHSKVDLLLFHVKIPIQLECAIIKVVREWIFQVKVLHTSDQLHRCSEED